MFMKFHIKFHSTSNLNVSIIRQASVLFHSAKCVLEEFTKFSNIYYHTKFQNSYVKWRQVSPASNIEIFSTLFFF